MIASSDLLIATSYYLVPVFLVMFVWKRTELVSNGMFLMFSAFILACGTTHLMAIWTLWELVYWLDASVKAVTAGLSVATAVAVGPVIPKALALPNATELEDVNRELQKQIAERDDAAKKLQMSEQKFRSLLESAPDAMVIVNEQGRIELINTQTEHLFGYCREELIHESVERLIPERLRSCHEEHRFSFSMAPRVRPMGAGMELFARRKDGSEFPVEISLSPIRTENEMLITAAVRDITERKRAERLLQEKERLATLGTTAAVFAHEIANPLNGISTSLQLVRDAVTDIDPEVRDSLEASSAEIERLTQLLKDYRSFARPQRLNLQLVDLQQIIREVLASEGGTYAAKAIDLEFQISDELPPIHADREKLKQVILNLAKNALEAMGEGGKLTIHLYRSDEYAVLEMADTGEGIPQNLDVFQMFTTTKRDGTGLGLSIVQQIISDHRGVITYTTERGRGTTFKVLLPFGSNRARTSDIME